MNKEMRIGEIMITEEEIAQKINELANQINNDYKDKEKEVT